MKILLPIDTSICSGAAARTIVAQFRPEQTEVRVMHAVEWPKELPTYLAFAEGPTAARDVLDAHSDQLERGQFLVDGVAQELRAAGFTTSTAVHEGSAKEMILAAADEWRPDVIVIGSHSRTGVDRLFLGSVAEHVMRSADCPVEVVPAGAFTDAEQDTAESASRGDRATSIPASSRSSSASGRATMRFSK